MGGLSQPHNCHMALRNREKEQCACKHGLTTTFRIWLWASALVSSCSPSLLFPSNHFNMTQPPLTPELTGHGDTHSDTCTSHSWQNTLIWLVHFCFVLSFTFKSTELPADTVRKRSGRRKTMRTLKFPLLISWVKRLWALMIMTYYNFP